MKVRKAGSHTVEQSSEEAKRIAETFKAPPKADKPKAQKPEVDKK